MRADVRGGWGVRFLLALGDCPEVFFNWAIPAHGIVGRELVFALVLRRSEVSSNDLDRVAASCWWWGGTHNVVELFDEVLSNDRRASLLVSRSNGSLPLAGVRFARALLGLSWTDFRAGVLEGCERFYPVVRVRNTVRLSRNGLTGRSSV